MRTSGESPGLRTNQIIILQKAIFSMLVALKTIKIQHWFGIIHLAAESHVDRSIHNLDEFAVTNIIGTIRRWRHSNGMEW